MDFSVSQVAVFAWFAIVGVTRSLIVRARAGCGKTTTIVEGIRTYVRACLAVKAPIRVLATSFAKKITVELASRLADLKAVGVDVRSLNSLGNSFILGKLGYRVKLDDTARKFDIARAMAPDATPEAIACLAKLHTKCRALLPLATCGADLEGLAEQFDLGPTDEFVPAGKRLAVMIMSSDREFTLWPRAGTELTVDLTRSSFSIPIVGGVKALNAGGMR
jgi:hypothetical protein